MSMYKSVWRNIDSIRVAPENAKLYKPVLPTDPAVRRLAQSIIKFGLLEPYVITTDGFLLSGERRFVGGKIAGLKRVPVRVYPISRERNPEKFVQLLREFNRQRLKTNDQQLREEIISCDKKGSPYDRLLEHRERNATVSLHNPVELREVRERSEISAAKRPFLDAILKVIKERQGFWPLSVRQIHYNLLNNPPLKHARKPHSLYCNDRKSYQALDELTVRARLTYEIPPEAIDDETRPLEVWSLHQEVQPFIQQEVAQFLLNYRRDLMQSQPNHIEIVAEKLTVQSIVRPVAERYCIPYTIGRGFANLPVRQKMEERFLASGKENLLLLFLADHDPDGEEIVHSFCRSMRDDFFIENVQAVKVALTAEQVVSFDLQSDNISSAKTTSPNYARFAAKYGEAVYELEAASPQQLQDALQQAIDAVVDHQALDAEIEAEKKEAVFLDKVRKTTVKALGAIKVA